MGNVNVKPHPKPRTKKLIRWKGADRPSPPGKPYLVQENGFVPNIIHISWSEPFRNGGSSVTSYLVEHKRLGATHWTTSSSSPISTNSISVSNLEPGWRYQFRVRAENVVGLSDPSEISEPFTVNAQKTIITPPKFTEELGDVVVLENDRVDLEVHFLGQPPPNICWFKDGYEIFSGNRTRITTFSDKSILTILKTSATDEGEIKCTGTNKAGHSSTKSKLTVEAPPAILLPKLYQDQDGIIFEIGETIKLNVTISGRPTPLIFWSHNGESIQNDDRNELEFIDKTASLKIENALRTDRGEYQIRAVNKLGQDVASFLMTITNKPTPPGQAKVLLTSGRSVTLSWSTPDDDGGCKIGNYIIEYYRIGWNVWLKAATSRRLSTELGDLIEGSQYKFRVKAESPYGISEPSEESETVFIPDPKRGINVPKDVLNQTENSQDSLRKRRAGSSPRVSFALNDQTPVRPERKKTGKTPEASPRMKRKQILDIPDNFETSVYARKFSMPLPKNDRISHSASPNQTPQNSPSSPFTRQVAFNFPENTINNFQRYEVNKSPSPEIIITEADPPNFQTFIQNEVEKNDDKNSRTNETNFKTPSGNEEESTTDYRDKIRPPLTRQDFSGSSEFMLVLCPEGEQGAQFRKLGINFEDNLIPPPLSLSAPELGTEPPDPPFMKRSSSSTELLNYRFMERLNEEAMNETTKNTVDIKQNQENIPMIRVNSKEAKEDIVGLEKKHSVNRRMSTGVLIQYRPKWSHRRQSLKNPDESNTTLEKKLHKFEATDENKREIMEYRQADFDELTPSEEDVEFQYDGRKSPSYYDYEDEEETYNPRSKTISESQSEDNKPFEILTVRKEPPNLNIVPKPILKKTTRMLDKNSILQLNNSKYSRDETSFNEYQKNDMIDISRYQKNIDGIQKSSKRRSFSLIPGQMKDAFKGKYKNEVHTPTSKGNMSMNISALANATSIAATSMVIPEVVNKKNTEEEAKVVVDFYGDLVKNLGGKSRPIAEFSSTMVSKYDTYEERKISEIKPNVEPHIEKLRNQSQTVGNQPRTFERQDTARDSYTPQCMVKSPQIEMNQQFDFNIPIPTKAEIFSKTHETTEKKQPILQPQGRDYVRTKSPSPREHSLVRSTRQRSSSRSSSVTRRRKTPKSRDASTSPVRFENWENRSSRSSLDREYYNRSLNSSRASSLTRRSPSPRPMLREITTQTSFRIEPKTPIEILKKQEELATKAEKTVKGVFEYSTDLAMVSVASWLYLFQNEYLAIPFLLILVYRQLNEKMYKFKENVKNRIPDWIVEKFNRKS